MKLWLKMILAIVVGVVLGFFLQEKALFLKPVGSIFLNLLSMVVGILVFSSMVVGIASMSDLKKLGRVGIKSLSLYLITTALAIGVSLAVGLLINPGKGLNLSLGQNVITAPEVTKLGDMITNLFPSNPFLSFVEGNILQIIVFACFFGISIQFSGKKGESVLSFFNGLSEVMLSMTQIIMKFAPYGVIAIMAWISGSFGLVVLFPLFKFLCAHYLACVLHTVFILGGFLWFFAKLRLIPFFKGMSEAIVCAASITSSSATLPVTMRCVQNNLGVSSSVAGFVLPLGATVNMNGTAIFQGLAAIFVAQAYGIHLTVCNLIIVVITATLSAVGSAGIPGGGIVTLSLVLSSIGLPLEGIAILAGIDRLRDIIGTVVNILGDAVVALVVAKTEGEIKEIVPSKAFPLKETQVIRKM